MYQKFRAVGRIIETVLIVTGPRIIVKSVAQVDYLKGGKRNEGQCKRK